MAREIRAEDIDDLDFELPDDGAGASGSGPPAPLPEQRFPPNIGGAGGPSVTGTKEEVYKTWTSFYPIYLDAKRAHKTGERRVSRDKALKYPLAVEMAQAAGRLGFKVVFEQGKTHPRDWGNPGRIKVLLKNENTGKPINPRIPDKYQLLLRISAILQPLQPKPPPRTSSNGTQQTSREASTNGKQAGDQSKPKNKTKRGGRRVKKTKSSSRPFPQQPDQILPIERLLPPHSPALSHGLLDFALEGKTNLASMMGMGGMEEEPSGGQGSGKKEKGKKGKKK